MSFSFENGGSSLLDFLEAEKSYRDTRLACLNLIGSSLSAAAQMKIGGRPGGSAMNRYAAFPRLLGLTVVVAGCERKVTAQDHESAASAEQCLPATAIFAVWKWRVASCCPTTCKWSSQESGRTIRRSPTRWCARARWNSSR